MKNPFRKQVAGGLRELEQVIPLDAWFLTPARVRWYAARELWRQRRSLRRPEGRNAMRLERDTELAETLPFVIVIALIAAMTLFVALPAQLGTETSAVLALAWPMWAVQVAPMVCAQTMALLNAPGIAIQLTEREAGAFFTGNIAQRSRQAAVLSLPWIVAHGAVCAASACLLVVFSMGLGLLAGFVLNVGDLARTADLLLTQVSPWAWLRAGLGAAVLGAVCAATAVLYAWPGTQSFRTGTGTHRLGLRATWISSVACALAGMAMNWLAATVR